MNLQSIISNVTGMTRWETLEGRKCIVVPMVMMVEGVLNGSSGALYYSANELAKVPQVWNHKPVVINHPSFAGRQLSACDPETIEAYKVGIILNTTFDGKRLKAEAWLDPDRVRKIDIRVMEALEASRMMEVSTGVFVEAVTNRGVYKGRPYDALATNLRPDHLAILPDEVGACSIMDGAGLLRINKKDINFHNVGDPEMKKAEIIAQLLANEHWGDDDKEFLESCKVAQLEKMVTNTVTIEKEVIKEVVKEEDVKDEDVKDDDVKQLTLNEFLATAPPTIGAVLSDLLANDAARKVTLIKGIIDNKQNAFTESQLKTFSTSVLEGIHKIAKGPEKPVVNYAGNGNVVAVNGGEVKPLMLPDYSKKKGE